MCPLTWVPIPSRKRPPESTCKSRAVYAIVIGDLGKAIATWVCSFIWLVLVAASTRGKKESWEKKINIFDKYSTIVEIPYYESIDIDTIEDWKAAELFYEKKYQDEKNT